MNNLVLLDEGLVNVYQNEGNERIVDARELHEFLEVGKDFTSWIKSKLTKYGFEEGLDYYLTFTKIGERKNVTKHDYKLKMDTAKEIAMVENNDKGRQVRKYFIEVEKQYSLKPMTNLQMLQSMINQMVIQEEKLSIIENVMSETNNKVIHLETEFNNETVMEGYRNGANIARKLGVYSIKDKPHSGFIDRIAKHLSIHSSKIGYKDEYVNVVRTNKFGQQTGVEVYYSDKSVEMFEKFLNEEFNPQAEYYKRGDKKGQFKLSSIELNGGNHNFNKNTYEKYKKE